MSNEEINWLVKDLLPATGTSIIGAAPKTGKSVLARQLCAAVNNGDLFLGRETVQGPALYFSTQESPEKIVNHFRRMGYGTMPPVIAERQVDCHNAVEELDATLEINPGFKLVVIDMIADFLPITDVNDYQETRKVFAGIAALADKHQLHIAVTHHNKKMKQENSVHDLLGSTAMPGGVDQIIILSVDRSKNRYIDTHQRYGESIEETAINWNADRMMMFLGKATSELAQELKDVAKERVDQAVLTFIMNNPGCQRSQVLAKVNGDQNTKAAALEFFQQSGMVLRSGTGKRGDPFTYRETQLQTV